MTDAVKVEAKPYQRSLTIIFSWLTIAGGILTAVQGSGLVLPAKVAGGVVVAIGIITQLLRFRTSQPVALSLTPGVGEAPAPPWTPSVAGPPKRGI